MIKLSACIEMIFRELDFCDRIAAVKQAGLPAFEFWGLGGKDLEAIEKASKQHELPIAAFTMSSIDPELAGLWQKSGLVDPDGHDIALKVAQESIAIAQKLNAKNIIVTVGQEIKDLSRSIQHDSIIENLKMMAPLAERAGVTLVVEPLNIAVNHKGYYLYSSAEGFDIIRAVGSPNVKLLYDIYHQQVTEGNLIQTITENIELIGHFHVADVPGRHEPGTGEINYANVLKAIDETGYNGYVGLEYAPKASALESLQKVKALAGL
jgi:hydroxypyruvate isomerase